MPLIVAHPDTQHSVQAALGLKKAGMLKFLFTGLSLRRPEWFGPALRVLAPGAHARLAQHRSHVEFDSHEYACFHRI